MKKTNLKKALTVLSFLIGVVALYASLKGVFCNNIYQEISDSGVISKHLIWASKAQDIVSAFIAVGIIIVAVLNSIKPGFLKSVTLIGLVWYFLYAYGLYVMQGAYTSIYPLYLVIFSLSVYAMIMGLISYNIEDISDLLLSKKLRTMLIIFFLIIVAFLTPIWTMKMFSDVNLRQPGDTYAVFIMDLGVVFPAMIITVYLLVKKHGFAIIMAGICLIKTFTLCLSWTFAEWINPVGGQPVELQMAGTSAVLSTLGLILLALYIREVRKQLKQSSFKLKTRI